MGPLPSDWLSLAAVVFLLGMRHGFDADHLATIDGLTRAGGRARLAHARYSGALFSLGHGGVVVAIAVAVGCASARWQAPTWLEAGGAWISIFFLTLLGTLNLRAVFTAAPRELVAPVGLRGGLVARVGGVDRPWVVALIGALFALSFDTVSQAALFAVAGTRFGGVAHAALLGLLFLTGMLVTDGVNGLWIARLIARSDALACVASRVMGFAVGSVSLLVAALAGARLAAPRFAAWSEGREMGFGAGIVLVVAASFCAGRWLARRGGGWSAAA